MKRRTWRWVSLSDRHTCVFVWDGKKPSPRQAGSLPHWHSPMINAVVVVCAKEFQRMFGFCPKPGECIKVEFSAKVIQ
jgi:hypothetical protein